MDHKRPVPSQEKSKGGKKRKTDKDRTPLNDPSKSNQPSTSETQSSAVDEKSTRPSLPDKIFNDPIHGHIEINPMCVKIIDTPQFQRLRSIKQLGGTYFVYPGASHNRFEHSIGVCHLAGQFVSALRVGQSELNITDDDVLCVQIAGLCHDLGHGPFSHMFDRRFLPSLGNGTKHESLSVKMFDHLVEENKLDTEFSVNFKEDLGRNKKFIAELIEGLTKDETQGWPYKGRDQEKRFLYEIVANKRNGIDVDKWDYFARDCHMLGIKNSFDHTRCMKFARVVEVDGEKQICFRDKEIENLYEMFHTRDMLHRRAYQHSVGNIIEIMISEAMEKANKHILTPGKMLGISETLDDMAAYENLTDSIVDRIICSTDDNLKESRDILKKVKERKLYKCVGHIRKEINKTTLKEEYCLKLKKIGSGLHENDIVIDVVNLNYGMKDKNPIDFVRFYTKENPNVAIEVKKDEVSDLLPEKFAEQRIRFFCKRDDKKSLKEAEQVLTDWCNEKNCTAVIGSQIIATTPVKKNQAGGTSTN
nr:deoxynucleoside triphosphate triphosphohydrolase SAMHD1 isoform X3 [Crassostrea gigas]